MKINSLLTAVVFAASVTASAAPSQSNDDTHLQTAPERVTVELEPAGVAPGTTVRQARIAQNWLLLGLGAAALAGIILGLSTSDSDTATTTN